MFKKELNPSQWEAVCFTEGPLLVIAGAGSGKTRTITYRVAKLVNQNVSPGSILLLTFTRKASYEMLKRASQLLDNRCENVSGGTFHSFAYSVMRKHADRFGYGRGFSILDRADSEGLIGILRKEIGVGSGSRAFPRKQTLANIFSRSVNKVMTVEEIVYDDYPHFAAELDTIAALFAAYRRRKIEANLFDYDDLLVYLSTLLREHKDVRERLSSQFRYIMVDEYQDTNQIQAEIVYLLAGDNRNVMAVGDDSQSIFSFRGAHFKNIISFPDMFSGTRIVRLEENYRSVQPILNLANAVIERAKEKYTKILYSRKKEGNLPVLVAAEAENSQSRFIVQKVQELYRNGVPYRQMAILFRASFHAFDLEIELNREEIPYIKVGGFKFIESAHIKDLLAHLRVIYNPLDRLSWYRVLLLLDKVGPKTAAEIYNAISEEKTGYTGILSGNVKFGKSAGFVRLKSLFAQINAGDFSVPQIGETILNYYLGVLKEKYDDYPKRARDLEQLVSIMERYDSLPQFLTDMALEPPSTSINEALTARESEEDCLILSTVHSAKGLEWHTVFIIWCLDGRFPSIHALDKEAELEEERRLLYVAATRAMENLFFIYPEEIYDRSSGRILSRPSRFIDMMPDNILRKESAGIW